MRKQLLLGLVVFSHVSALSQVPNESFENWVGTEPVAWTTNNVPAISVFPITPSSTSHHGMLAMKGEVVDFMSAAIPPVVYTNTQPLGFPIDKKFQCLYGYFQYSPVGGDALKISVGMTRNGAAVGGGELVIVNPQNTWQEFVVDINYISNDTSSVPDHCMINITITNIPVTHAGSAFLLDALAFCGEQLFTSFSTFGSHTVISQNFLDLSATAEGADDFVVPAGSRWTLQAVEILGSYTRGGQGFQSATVNVRADDNNKPGPVIFSDTTFINRGPNFFIILRDTVGFGPGRYWLNFVVNMPRGPDTSYFGWATSASQAGAPFHWRDPNNILGFNVPAWAPGNQNGVGGGDPDLVFELLGYQPGTTGVVRTDAGLPDGFALGQNYPNPFNPSTRIVFTVPQQSLVTLRVHNLLGQIVATPVHEELSPGEYAVNWNASGLSSGTYFYSLTDGQRMLTRRMILLK
ncbi:MAG: T9SS type A sorting domain-containing protein [Bacteroidetes bacterium]|nr:T9SS type A sorting domain-containing protein [Bacteroidota bacterium]MCW5895465.1 T9SS type A sorting domain-containing protein [Bacteroidota bacterium]